MLHNLCVMSCCVYPSRPSLEQHCTTYNTEKVDGSANSVVEACDVGALLCQFYIISKKTNAALIQ